MLLLSLPRGLAQSDSWLLLRGMKTMPLRVAAAQANALELAAVLRHHPAVTAVHYVTPDDARELSAGACAVRGRAAVLTPRRGARTFLAFLVFWLVFFCLLFAGATDWVGEWWPSGQALRLSAVNTGT